MKESLGTLLRQIRQEKRISETYCSFWDILFYFVHRQRAVCEYIYIYIHTHVVTVPEYEKLAKRVSHHFWEKSGTSRPHNHIIWYGTEMFCKNPSFVSEKG